MVATSLSSAVTSASLTFPSGDGLFIAGGGRMLLRMQLRREEFRAANVEEPVVLRPHRAPLGCVHGGPSNPITSLAGPRVRRVQRQKCGALSATPAARSCCTPAAASPRWSLGRVGCVSRRGSRDRESDGWGPAPTDSVIQKFSDKGSLLPCPFTSAVGHLRGTRASLYDTHRHSCSLTHRASVRPVAGCCSV